MGMTISFHISLVFFSFFIASSCKTASLSRRRFIVFFADYGKLDAYRTYINTNTKRHIN